MGIPPPIGGCPIGAGAGAPAACGAPPAIAAHGETRKSAGAPAEKAAGAPGGGGGGGGGGYPLPPPPPNAGAGGGGAIGPPTGAPACFQPHMPQDVSVSCNIQPQLGQGLIAERRG